ncbi:MAG: hypothetical protein ABJM06_12040 [Gilvibacter sp.]
MKRLFFTAFFLIAIPLFLGCSGDDDVQPTDDMGQTDDTTDDATDDTSADFLGELDWAQTYGGSGQDVASASVQTPDGGYAVVGFTQSTDGDITDKTATDSDFWVFKMAPDGSLLWSKTFGGSADDRGADIINTQDGGLAVTGFSRSDDGDASANEGFQDYWIVKLDASGNLQWEQSFGFAGSDQASALIQTTDGGYFVTGFLDITASGGQGNDGFASAPSSKSTYKHGVGEFWGLRLDATGNLIWRRYFGGTNNDRSYDVIQTSDGGFLMSGSSESDDFDISDPNGSYDFWAVRINDAGDLLWEKSFGGSQIDISYGMTQLANGNFVLVGDSRSTDGDVSNPIGNADFWAVAMDDSGNMLWEKSFGGTLFDSARAIKVFDDTSLVIAGSTRSDNNQVSNNYGQNDGWIIGTTANGSLIWELSVGGSLIDVLSDVIVLNDQTVLAVGDTESADGDIVINKGAQDALIVKLK